MTTRILEAAVPRFTGELSNSKPPIHLLAVEAFNTDGVREETRADINRAFHRMYAIALELKPRFLKGARTRCISEIDAEEIFQDVMVRFWQRIDQIDHSSNIKAFIWRRLLGALKDRGRAVDYLSQRQRRKINPVLRTLTATGNLDDALAQHGLTMDDWLKLNKPRKGYAEVVLEGDLPEGSHEITDLPDKSPTYVAMAEGENAKELEDFLLGFLKYIPVRDALFIFLYCGLGYSNGRVAALFGYSHERISQIRDDVFMQLPKRLLRFLRFDDERKFDLIEDLMKVRGKNFSSSFMSLLQQELAANSVTPEEERLVARVFANEIVEA